MHRNLEQIIFLLSSDYFAGYVSGIFCRDDIELLRRVSRKYVKIFMNGYEDYYLHPEFGLEKIELYDSFFGELISEQVSSHSIGAIEAMINSVNRDERWISVIFTAIDISSKLLYLNLAELYTAFDEELSELFLRLAEYDIQLPSEDYEEESWLKAQSDWDKYLLRITNDVPETIFNIYRSANKIDLITLDSFFSTWKTIFSSEEYSKIRSYVLKETHSQLTNNLDMLIQQHKATADSYSQQLQKSKYSMDEINSIFRAVGI